MRGIKALAYMILYLWWCQESNACGIAFQNC
jgi:hypothetical protein